MKKALKIISKIVLGIVAFCAVATTLCYIFLDEIKAYAYGIDRAEMVEKLLMGGEYSADGVEYRFSFKADSVKANEIREYFRLDTIVNPAADTWANTLALARFVARNIPHANQAKYPEQSNAIALWEYTKNVESAFNCRLHAIMLHELLAASGITSRFVTCMPADPEDPDCHVVNIAWLPERNKWAMIDSDQRAYLTDGDGTPLSLEEMRERYMADSEIVIHDLLGRDTDQTYYRAYWAKNLFWFNCWEESAFNKESHRREGRGRLIYLVPEGFEAFGMGDNAIRTTDARKFWTLCEGEIVE